MNGVEAAASLFGPEEPASDPFASLSDDTNACAPLENSELPNPKTRASDYPHSEQGLLPRTVDAQIQSTSVNYQHSPRPYGGTQDSESSYTESNYAWYDGHQQWTDSSQPAYDTTQAIDFNPSTYQQTAQYDVYTPTQKYSSVPLASAYSRLAPDQYALSRTQDVHTSAQQIHESCAPLPQKDSYAHVQPAYDPYIPVNEQNAHSPHFNYSNATKLSLNYDPYSPQQKSVYNQTPSDSAGNVSAQSRGLGLSAVPPPTTSIVPPVPIPAAPVLNRPKVSNAYDPPFPTVTSRRSASGRSTKANQSYAAYSQYQQAATPQLMQSQIPQPSVSKIAQQPTNISPTPEAPDNNNWDHPSMANPQLPYGHSNGFTGAVSGQKLNFNPSNQTIVPHTQNDLHDIPATDLNHMVQSPSLHSLEEPLSSIVYPNDVGDDYPSTLAIQSDEAYEPFQDTEQSMNMETSPHPLSRSIQTFPDNPSSYTNNFALPPPPQPGSLVDISTRQSSVAADSPTLGHSILDKHRASSSNLHGSENSPIKHDPYAPASHSVQNKDSLESFAPPSSGHPRTASPSSLPMRPSSRLQNTNPYAPPTYSPSNRSMSISSVAATATVAISHDSYSPDQRVQPQLEATQYQPFRVQEETPLPHSQGYEVSISQDLLAKPSFSAYAPSPSLLGTNDPLSRTSARVPVINFGFGGKLVTCFHGAASLSTGFDVALSSRNSSGVEIRLLKKVLPETVFDVSSNPFPGPLRSESGAQSTSLVRTGATQTKTKKAEVAKYLSSRADEISQGLGYLDEKERRRAEGKLTLVKLLKIMIENDGRLSGTTQIDDAVRVALVPRLEISLASEFSGETTVPAYSSAFVDGQNLLPGISLGGTPDLNDSTVLTTATRPSSLDKIEEFLLKGERQKAYHFALDERLWAHAMIIASSIDKEAWKEAVNEFLRSELRVKENIAHSDRHPASGRESLRVAYSLFAGQGAAAVQELLPLNSLSKGLHRLHLTQKTPRTPNFTVNLSASMSDEALARWAETVVMMIASPVIPEASSALTALGDQLLSHRWIEAAHVCYLLSPQTSPLGGIRNSTSRLTLVGCSNPQIDAKDDDYIILTEILEFALSLPPVSKGQEPYSGLAHLQAYRLLRAVSLAELGDIHLASRYCEAISSSLNRKSPYFTPALYEQLNSLIDRINGVAHSDKSSSWIGGKISKPSLDTIGGWLENRFTNLVTGGSEATPTADDSKKAENRQFNGPFAHYSTISSNTPSARSSPQPSINNMNVLSAVTGAVPPNYQNRSASAMSHRAPVAANIPRSSSTIQNYSARTYQSSQDLLTPKPLAESNELDTPVQEPSWWNSYSENATTLTSTEPQDVDTGFTSSEGFMSPMDKHSFDVDYRSSVNIPAQHNGSYDEQDDDDLGLGNTSNRRKTTSEEDESREGATPTPTAPVKAVEPARTEPASNGSWLSRWWKRSDSTTPGPVKASLGEESSFYYDKDLKRWVNKKAGAEETVKPPAPTPPPPRAQTASPAMTGNRIGPDATQPPRSASAIDLSTSPPSKTVLRVRSNLIPPPDSAPSTPTGTRLTPQSAPPGRPKSQASKRNVRSRYVDVLQQEIGGA